jgi:hypothetical protein
VEEIFSQMEYCTPFILDILKNRLAQKGIFLVDPKVNLFYKILGEIS